MNNKEEIIEESTCEIDKYGTKRWYNSKGEFHRQNDLPAIEYADGFKEWWLNGLRHRDNDKPAIERSNGTKKWYLNNKYHRENGFPAIIEANGAKAWYLNDKLHREKGPAIEYADGKKSWYWHGKRMEVNNQEEFEEKLPYLIMKDIHDE